MGRENSPICGIKLPHFSLRVDQLSHHIHSSINKCHQWNVQHQLPQPSVPKSIIGEGDGIIVTG